jgi:hypothetical protein
MTPPAARRRTLAALAGLALVPFSLAVAPAARAQDPRASLVQDAARDWLALVDREDFAGSWQAAGARFREKLDAQRWKVALGRVRTPLGAVTRRTTIRTSFTKTFRGAPPGDYAVVQFRTSWQNLAEGVEQVTVERERDGHWRVVGYLIR